MVAEVVKVSEIKPLADTAHWVLGYFVWRDRAVPLISFEALCGGNKPETVSRLVIFYPLPGRHANDYFAVVAAGSPQSVSINPDNEAQTIPDSIPAGLVGGALKIEDRIALVPDFETIGQLFYANS